MALQREFTSTSAVTAHCSLRIRDALVRSRDSYLKLKSWTRRVPTHLRSKSVGSEVQMASNNMGIGRYNSGDFAGAGTFFDLSAEIASRLTPPTPWPFTMRRSATRKQETSTWQSRVQGLRRHSIPGSQCLSCSSATCSETTAGKKRH